MSFCKIFLKLCVVSFVKDCGCNVSGCERAEGSRPCMQVEPVRPSCQSQQASPLGCLHVPFSFLKPAAQPAVSPWTYLPGGWYSCWNPDRHTEPWNRHTPVKVVSCLRVFLLLFFLKVINVIKMERSWSFSEIQKCISIFTLDPQYISRKGEQKQLNSWSELSCYSPCQVCLSLCSHTDIDGEREGTNTAESWQQAAANNWLSDSINTFFPPSLTGERNIQSVCTFCMGFDPVKSSIQMGLKNLVCLGDL